MCVRTSRLTPAAAASSADFAAVRWPYSRASPSDPLQKRQDDDGEKSSADDATPTDGPLYAGTSLVMLLSSDEACGRNHHKDAIERFVKHVTDQRQSGPVIARGELAQPAVDGVDDHRSFANAGCHSFYGIGTNVADGEDSLNAGCIGAGS